MPLRVDAFNDISVAVEFVFGEGLPLRPSPLRGLALPLLSLCYSFGTEVESERTIIQADISSVFPFFLAKGLFLNFQGTRCSLFLRQKVLRAMMSSKIRVPFHSKVIKRFFCRLVAVCYLGHGKHEFILHVFH